MSFWTYPSERYYYSWYDAPPPGPPSDAEIKSMVVDQLRVNPYTKDDDLTVDVKKGVVILNGAVRSALAKRAASDDSWDTPGVVDVSNNLTIAAARVEP